MNEREYIFKIDAFTPDRLPMKRLAEYLYCLSTLYGSQERVHFVKLKKGSAAIVKRVEFESIPKVRERLNGIKHREAPQDAIEAYSELDNMLAEDNAVGVIQEVLSKKKTAKVLEFPGRMKLMAKDTYGAVTEPSNVDGVLIRIGGLDETVPVLLLEEEKFRRHCTCNREVARQLAPHIFGPIIRASGIGRWQRDEFGNWVMEKFTIKSFEALESSRLLEATAELRAIPSDLERLDDPLGELRELRHGKK